jgi:hypothetical protein
MKRQLIRNLFALRIKKKARIFYHVTTPVWGAHAPRVLSLAPRQQFLILKQEQHFGEAPKWAREARALPRKDASKSPCCYFK